MRDYLGIDWSVTTRDDRQGWENSLVTVDQDRQIKKNVFLAKVQKVRFWQ
jgi:hypothetical protein